METDNTPLPCSLNLRDDGVQVIWDSNLLSELYLCTLPVSKMYDLEDQNV